MIGRWTVLLVVACEPTVDYAGIELGCTSTGGTLTTLDCCQDTRDYPITCGVEACNCITDLEPVLYCQCGAGTCFNGEACVVD